MSKDLEVMQNELFETVGQATLYLNRNGMRFDAVHDLIIQTVEDSFLQMKTVLEKEREN